MMKTVRRHRLKWSPLLPNEVGRIAQEGTDGKKKREKRGRELEDAKVLRKSRLRISIFWKPL